jgi:hypothetical protein
VSFITLVVLSHVFYLTASSVSCLLLDWLFCLMSFIRLLLLSRVLLDWLFSLVSFIALVVLSHVFFCTGFSVSCRLFVFLSCLMSFIRLDVLS